MKAEKDFDNLEQFLQSEADNQKMYPSDDVWANISKQIQPKKSWPALTIISLFILGSLSVATFFNYPPENPLSKLHFSFTKKELVINAKSSLTKQAIKANLHQNILAESEQRTKIKINNAVTGTKNNNSILSFDELSSDLAQIQSNNHTDNPATSVNSKSTDVNKPFEKGLLASINDFSLLDHQAEINKRLKKANPLKDGDKQKENEATKGKLDYEIYATPSISFRTLSDDQVVSRYSGNTTSNSSANSKVNQTAGMGSEIGIGYRYKTAKDFTLKFGVQFNIRQYYIDAYQSQGLATIEVFQNNQFDSINVSSKYGNSRGGTEIKLTNRLYQVSIPIGLEWNAFNYKHIGLNLSASIQPTYSLNTNEYIISTDYKYYANGESLFRKWNVNSAISADFSYKLKKSTLYIGPQIRYQHLPTYVDKYPIKEYRVDYGVRVGIIKSIK